MNNSILPAPTEDEEQEALFRWIAYASAYRPELRLFIHIPNEGKRSVKQGAKLKRIGLRPGVPDLFLPVASGEYHGLFIELKRTKGGRTSREQEEWISSLKAQGYAAHVCFGWDEARKVTCEYMNKEKECKAAK